MKNKRLAVYIFILIGMISGVFFINYLHYYNMDITYVRNGILLNLLSIVSNVCIGVCGLYYVNYIEEKGYDWLLFILSPLLFLLPIVLLKTGGVSVNGCVWWLNFGPGEIHYFQYVLYIMFIAMPVAIDGVIKKFKYEKIIFAGVTFINMMLLMSTKDLQGMGWYGAFSLLYYSLKRGKHILPIATIIISLLSGVAYNLYTDKIFHVYESGIDASANKFAYRYPLISLHQEFTIIAVFLVIVLELLVCFLLGIYIKKYVQDAYKKRANVLYVIMSGMWIVEIVFDLLPYEILAFGSTPFSTNEGYLYLVPIIIIFSLAKETVSIDMTRL